MCVCRWKLKFHLPDEDLRFFHRGYPWFSRSQVLERATYTQRTPNYQELDRSESGLRFNSKCVGVAKNGGGANVRSRVECVLAS